MLRARPLAIGLAVLLAATGAAMAEDLPDAKSLAKALYKTGKRATMVNILQPDMVPAPYKAALENAVEIQHYFEAMAASPDEGMLAGSAFLATNHHTAAAAHASAIAGCNAKKKSGSKSCVVIAEFLPKDYKGPGVFSMSYTANEYFAKEFRRAKAPKAFAISPSAGSWGAADGAASTEAAQAAALADCSAKAAKVGAKDCKLISAD